MHVSSQTARKRVRSLDVAVRSSECYDKILKLDKPLLLCLGYYRTDGDKRNTMRPTLSDYAQLLIV